MPIKMPIAGAVAGATGSPYLAVLTYLAKANGNYILNETNFTGLGRFLPCWLAIGTGTPANVVTQISNDGGTTWKQVGAAGGGVIIADGITVRIVIAGGATDIFIFPIGL